MIPLVDLRAQNLALAPELESAFARVLRSGRYVLGEEVEAFEERFAAYCGTRYAVAVNSGTSALHLALLAAGIEPGDEVITTPMTFVATVAAVLYAGARPVLVDIDPVSRTLDPARIEPALSPRTRAIVPVHLHGGMADMVTIATIADTYNLAVIEDAAQAHGAEHGGRRAGSIGDLGCFSFYPGKNLGACGEGGAVVTNSADRAETLRLLRDWGQLGKYNHVLAGFNYRMEAVQAALLAVKLPHLEGWTQARRRRAAWYGELLRDAGIGLPRETPGTRHVFHAYAIELPDRGGAQQRLARAGIAAGIHYPVPVHLQPAYASLGYRRGDFPVAERFARSTLSLPLYPELRSEQIERVADRLCAEPVLEHVQV
jgi:dTDP-4-amino-4,6-dideoxygalactose transaminase